MNWGIQIQALFQNSFFSKLIFSSHFSSLLIELWFVWVENFRTASSNSSKSFVEGNFWYIKYFLWKLNFSIKILQILKIENFEISNLNIFKTKKDIKISLQLNVYNHVGCMWIKLYAILSVIFWEETSRNRGPKNPRWPPFWRPFWRPFWFFQKFFFLITMRLHVEILCESFRSVGPKL